MFKLMIKFIFIHRYYAAEACKLILMFTFKQIFENNYTSNIWDI